MQQSAELREILLGFYRAVSTGDISSIERMISSDNATLTIGTDPQEWWRGEDVYRAFREQLKAMGGKMKVKPGDPEAYEKGEVGWVADRPSFVLPDGTETPFRLSAVFVKERGSWKAIQTHASMGVPNIESMGKELPV